MLLGTAVVAINLAVYAWLAVRSAGREENN
jgi:hypothetical protein